MIEITIPGKPMAQKRHRVSKGRMYDPSSNDKKTIRLHMIKLKGKYKGTKQPLSVSIEAYFRPPRSWSKKKQRESIGSPVVVMPDLDNIAKIYLDAMNDFIYDDDNQIAVLLVRKMYWDEPMTIIQVEAMDEQA